MRWLALPLFIACASSTPEEPTPVTSSGSEEADRPALGALMGDPITPTDEAAAEPDRHRAEFDAQCSAVAVQPGIPPSPPQTPNRASVQSLEPTYQAALTPPPAPPATGTLADYNAWAQSSLTTWINDSVARLSALERGAAVLTTEDDRAIGAAWIAHAHGTLVENLVSLPAPLEIQRDPELLAIYERAFNDPMRPLVDKASQALVAAPPRAAAWVQYAQRLQRWLAQERCALHPGRP